MFQVSNKSLLSCYAVCEHTYLNGYGSLFKCPLFQSALLIYCSFLSRVPPNVRGLRHEVLLSTKHGVEAKSYEGLGDANKLKPLEVELKRLEDLSESIVQVTRHSGSE